MVMPSSAADADAAPDAEACAAVSESAASDAAALPAMDAPPLADAWAGVMPMLDRVAVA